MRTERELLKWVVEHDGECIGDHPKVLAEARALLAAGSEPVGYFKRNDGLIGGIEQVEDAFKNDPDVFPLYLAAMHGAGDGTIRRLTGHDGTWLGGQVYKAMLAAAPLPPTEPK